MPHCVLTLKLIGMSLLAFYTVIFFPSIISFFPLISPLDCRSFQSILTIRVRFSFRPLFWGVGGEGPCEEHYHWTVFLFQVYHSITMTVGKNE